MEIDRSKIYAVISGDIIGSSKLPMSERAELIDIMKQASNELRTFLAQSVPLSVDIYAGDSWQLLVSEPGDALSAAVFYRASIIAATEKKIDTRLAVALGKVDFVPGERASEGDGEAFRLSGRILKETSNKQQMRFIADLPDSGQLWDATFGLMDALMRNWSARQAWAVLGALQGWSQGEIAAQGSPPVERQTVGDFLNLANWHAIERTIVTFKNTFTTSFG